jgi:hypothetical protein
MIGGKLPDLSLNMFELIPQKPWFSTGSIHFSGLGEVFKVFSAASYSGKAHD